MLGLNCHFSTFVRCHTPRTSKKCQMMSQIVKYSRTRKRRKIRCSQVWDCLFCTDSFREDPARLFISRSSRTHPRCRHIFTFCQTISPWPSTTFKDSQPSVSSCCFCIVDFSPPQLVNITLTRVFCCSGKILINAYNQSIFVKSILIKLILIINLTLILSDLLRNFLNWYSFNVF